MSNSGVFTCSIIIQGLSPHSYVSRPDQINIKWDMTNSYVVLPSCVAFEGLTPNARVLKSSCVGSKCVISNSRVVSFGVNREGARTNSRALVLSCGFKCVISNGYTIIYVCI